VNRLFAILPSTVPLADTKDTLSGAGKRDLVAVLKAF
jgi:hypothetical protein